MSSPELPAATAPMVRGGFILCPCRPGAEAALAARQAAILPAFSRAAWRRGLATFRIGPGDFDPPDTFWPELVFAHTVVRSLGQVTGGSPAELAAACHRVVGDVAWDAVHAWRRDERLGHPADEVRAALAAECGAPADAGTRRGDLVLDCVIDGSDRWWLGWHRASTAPGTWPGGVYGRAAPSDAVSRAWLKIDEAVASLGVELEAGQRALELGAAPGGSCQRLLASGLDVIGVDAAVVAEQVASHPRFEQWRMRARDVPLARFRGFDWLLADMNIDPVGSMSAIVRLLDGGRCRPRGVIATLKLPAWSRAAELDGWLAAFEERGYVPRARQLSTGGREVCVVATRRGTAAVRSRRSRRATRSRGA